ncbi:hypothetical protein G6F70_000610 [Rhizopus microsporus]|uniref:Uncharacterized protein n=1 Tax=Rhizopus microsporus TaxID=58291 RepID=A0A0A1NX38_RHIZD|nr:hypothetical protein G6F71_000820 [Rhizopus microsporus]KAG1204295.1 hypothetical protein G6F70_000610 [Rhizopus microsporus]KAG1215689.1 hypothetical protein G6F69_000775 [Rhizopus microsporus]KAG1237954.1 hypothetical protein G6F67_000790 [Rhizopus microsporus]KAG1268432.1 hypothetical protein G6F68_001092 [Rhizopus microsporus]
MPKHILLDPTVVNIVVETILGPNSKDQYSPWPTEWPNRTVSDILYLPNSSEDNFPPILIEVQCNSNNAENGNSVPLNPDNLSC